MLPPEPSSSSLEEASQQHPLLGPDDADAPQPPPSPQTAAPRSARHRFQRLLRRVAIGAAFLVTGPTLIVVNSFLLNGGFPYPLLLCALGVVASGLFARVLVAGGWAVLSPASLAYASGTSAGLGYGSQYARGILPVCFFMGLSIASGNAAYLYLNVGIIQMLKAATPVLTMLAFAVTGMEIPTVPVAASVAVITVGTLVTVESAPRATIVGVGIMLLSSLAEAFRLICTQNLLTRANFRCCGGGF